ncbi:hypothetical protein AAXE64_27375 [Priestia megaterium]
MQLQTLEELFRLIPPDMQECFIDRFWEMYTSISTRAYIDAKPVIVPADLELVDYLSRTLMEVTSYCEFKDPFSYLDLTPRELEMFYSLTTEEYHFRFWTDMFRYTKREHVFLYTNHTSTFMNVPIKEVW